MNQITSILIEIIATALATAIVCLIKAGVDYLRAQSHSEKVQLALQEFQTVLEDGVGYVEQTFVRLAKTEGTWDKETQQQALKTCVEYVQDNLTRTTLDILTEDKTDIQAWITAKIESWIQNIKCR